MTIKLDATVELSLSQLFGIVDQLEPFQLQELKEYLGEFSQKDVNHEPITYTELWVQAKKQYIDTDATEFSIEAVADSWVNYLMLIQDKTVTRRQLLQWCSSSFLNKGFPPHWADPTYAELTEWIDAHECLLSLESPNKTYRKIQETVTQWASFLESRGYTVTA